MYMLFELSLLLFDINFALLKRNQAVILSSYERLFIAPNFVKVDLEQVLPLAAAWEVVLLLELEALLVSVELNFLRQVGDLAILIMLILVKLVEVVEKVVVELKVVLILYRHRFDFYNICY